MGPCCEQTHAAFEVELNLDQVQGVYSGSSDVVVSSQLRLCHACIIDVMDRTCRLYHYDTSLAGCQNSHYTTEKGKASALRELNAAHSASASS